MRPSSGADSSLPLFLPVVPVLDIVLSRFNSNVDSRGRAVRLSRRLQIIPVFFCGIM